VQAAGYRYAPFAMARYYLDNLDAYFTLFNVCRKQADKNAEYPHTPFVAFHLEGMRVVINRLHDRVNQIVAGLLFERLSKNSSLIFMKNFSWGQPLAGWIGQKPAGSHIHIHINQ